MDYLQEFVKGECMEMCPEDEVILREKENLVHILETQPGSENQRKKIADKKRMVKSYSRSAAGRKMQDPRHLRPPLVLLKTTEYLLDKVISNSRVPWVVTYDFITDRLQSVRQDMVIQNTPTAHSICILQPIVRFHAYAHYRLCKESIKNFDPHLNKKHLQECLKKLLYLYDDCDMKVNDEVFITHLQNIRPEFEALYILLNLGDSEALVRALNLPKIWRDGLVKLAMEISSSYIKNNFIRVCRMIKTLPPLLMAVISMHLPELRRRCYRIMSVAYNSKNLTFPVTVLKEILLYDKEDEVINDCKYYGLKCDVKNGVIHFIKTDFDTNKFVVPPTHYEFIDKKLDIIRINHLVLGL